MNIHQREYLGTTDQGVSMLRSALRRGIKAVTNNKPITVLEGSPKFPIPTYGGDTVLSLPKSSEDDTKYVEQVVNDIMNVYIAADEYSDDERESFKTREIVSRYPGSI